MKDADFGMLGNERINIMYTSTNYKTKKALKDAIAAGSVVSVYQPNDMFGNPQAAPDYSGRVALEGPHYPEAHRWYATGVVENGKLVKVS
jgi:hypothetical protein